VFVVDQKPTTGTQATSPGGSTSGDAAAPGSLEAPGPLDELGPPRLELPGLATAMPRLRDRGWSVAGPH
jgi:hypothetical protein